MYGSQLELKTYHPKTGVFILKYNFFKKICDLKSNVDFFLTFILKEKQNTYKKI